MVDWERRNTFPKHRLVPLRRRRNPTFTASLNSTAQFSFSSDNTVLNASAFVIDTISEVSEVFYLEGEESVVDPTLEIFHRWWTFFAANISFDEQSLDVFGERSAGVRGLLHTHKANSRSLHPIVSRCSLVLYNDYFLISWETNTQSDFSQ